MLRLDALRMFHHIDPAMSNSKQFVHKGPSKKNCPAPAILNSPTTPTTPPMSRPCGRQQLAFPTPAPAPMCLTDRMPDVCDRNADPAWARSATSPLVDVELWGCIGTQTRPMRWRAKQCKAKQSKANSDHTRQHSAEAHGQASKAKHGKQQKQNKALPS